MEKPLVSYVLTAYNIEDFIEESVKCAFARRTVSSLLKLIKPNDISFRTKLSYIKQHILYILSKK